MGIYDFAQIQGNFQPTHPNCHFPQILMPKDPENQEVWLAP